MNTSSFVERVAVFFSVDPDWVQHLDENSFGCECRYYDEDGPAYCEEFDLASNVKVAHQNWIEAKQRFDEFIKNKRTVQADADSLDEIAHSVILHANDRIDPRPDGR
jgi:hypothetical protein